MRSHRHPRAAVTAVAFTAIATFSLATLVAPPAWAQGTTKVVTTDAGGGPNYVKTIFLSALSGALLATMVGAAVYLLDSGDNDWGNLTYWAAGGVLAGAGVGLIQLAVQENRASRAISMPRPALEPQTYKVALLRLRF